MKILDQRFAELKAAGVQDPVREFEYFCEQRFGVEWCKQRKISGFINLDSDELSVIDDFFLRRTRREPVERILGYARICDRSFLIDPSVFRSGTETETTIGYGLKAIEGIDKPRVLDCGAGNGCILLSILSERPDASGVGIDNNDHILSFARNNAERLNADNRAEFLISDWGDNLSEKFDLIISNPPRIPTDLIKNLVKEVSVFDPVIALDGGENGAIFYRRTARLMKRVGTDNAVCIMQVGDIMLTPAIKEITREGFKKVTPLRDYKYAVNSLIFENRHRRVGVRDRMKALLKSFSNNA